MKRIFREPVDRVFGGVCSGLGAYFNTDPVFFRILFAGLIFSPLPIILIYILFWIIIPKRP